MRALYSLLKPYRGRMLLALLLAFCNVAGVLSLPVLFGRAIDCLAGENSVDFDGLFRILPTALFIACAAALCQYIETMLCQRIAYRVTASLRDRAFRKLQQLPVSWLDAHPAGETMSLLGADAEQLCDGILMLFSQFFPGVLTILLTLAFMLLQDIALTVVVLCITPLSLFAASFIASRTHRMFLTQADARARETALMEEMTGNVKVVRALGYEKTAMARFDQVNREVRDSSLMATFYASLTNPTTRFVNNILYAVLACMGAFRVLSGGFSVGELTCFLSYATQYTKPFNEITGVFAELQGAFTCAGRLSDFLALQEESAGGESFPGGGGGSVTADRIVFSYQPDKPFIRGLSLEAAPGRHIAIVGPTGCGKTTLMNLFLRFYSLQGGEIRIDGMPVSRLSPHALRGRFGMVLQDTWIRYGSVAQNIALGREGATMEEITEAARACGAHDFIRLLPEGYDTMLGEGKTELSEGQRQLLCIARVFLSRAQVILLDEATSSIDTMTEKRISAALERLMENRTAFIVAHRLSTIRSADEILVMKEGRIIERGDHRELLRKKGFYAELVKSQYAGVELKERKEL